jgi:hypothetical protein
MTARARAGVTTAGVVLAIVVGGAQSLSPNPGAPGGSAAVTFSEHVAPILFDNCTSCHRPGEAAPFALMSYNDARSRGRLIAAVTSARVMPPWKAAPGDIPFRNARRLTDAQIETLRQWVAGAMLEGDPRTLPRMPEFPEGWQLGAPDLVVTMTEPFPVPADGPDIYRNFVVPLNLEEDTWVRAVDFRPSARTVVHHSLFFLDDTGVARARDSRDPRPGFGGAMGRGVGVAGGRGGLLALLGLGGQGTTGRGGDATAVGRAGGTLGGWALGGQPQSLPDGLAYFVPRRSDLILSTHFHPSGREEREQSVVGLYFAERPPVKSFTPIQLPPVFGVFEGIDIPAGQERYAIHDSFVLPVDVDAFGVSGHAHYLGREMTLTATLPDGRSRTLLHIPDWDFSWQESYRFADLVRLPRGTTIDVNITYDNSAGNPRNPNHPPERVTWGEQSTDEMGSLTLQVMAVDEGDLPRLREAYAAHVRNAALTRPGLGQLLQRRVSGGRAVQR